MKLFRASRVVLIMLGPMYVLTGVDRVNVSTAAAGFGKEFGFSRTGIGIVFSGFAFSCLLFQVIGGRVGDRFGVRRSLIACGVVCSVATILTGFATGFWTLVVARVLLGFGEGTTFPATMSRWVSKEKRGFAQGIIHSAARVVLCGRRRAPGVGDPVGHDLHRKPEGSSAYYRRGIAFSVSMRHAHRLTPGVDSMGGRVMSHQATAPNLTAPAEKNVCDTGKERGPQAQRKKNPRTTPRCRSEPLRIAETGIQRGLLTGGRRCCRHHGTQRRTIHVVSYS